MTGYPLGRWLVAQRSKERRHLRATGTAWPPGRRLTELDPWWNPPWHFPWQRHYQQARTLWREGKLLLPGQNTPPGSWGDDKDPLTVWLRQCARHDVLQLEQQTLLADIAITAATARTVTTSHHSHARRDRAAPCPQLHSRAREPGRDRPHPPQRPPPGKLAPAPAPTRRRRAHRAHRAQRRSRRPLTLPSALPSDTPEAPSERNPAGPLRKAELPRLAGRLNRSGT